MSHQSNGSRYRILGNISSGAHGLVLKAQLRDNTSELNNEIDNTRKSSRHLQPSTSSTTDQQQTEEQKWLAIKRIFVRKRKTEYVQLIREIKTLQLLADNEHIVRLLDVYVHGSSVNLVFPLYPTNLSALIYEWQLDSYQRCAYAWLTLEALAVCHRWRLMHRDLKPGNCLIDWNGQLKLGDFGQTRPLMPLTEVTNERETDNPTDDKQVEIKSADAKDQSTSGWYSHQVCTRWYRAPELLYGATRYDQSVDIWSFGCVLAELLQQKPLFAGRSDIEQLCLVHQALGQPPLIWAQSLPDYDKISFFDTEEGQQGSSTAKDKKTRSSKKFLWQQKLVQNGADRNSLQVITQTICYDNRPTCKQLRLFSYFDQIRLHGLDKQKLIRPSTIRQRVGPARSE